MERIIYRLTLDTHKTGVQRTLQGFQTADNMARRIIISLVSGSDSIELYETSTVAMMYVTTENATEPSIHECTIEDNTIVYDVLPIRETGIVEMQIKLMDTSVNGAESVLALPKFALEVNESGMSDEGAMQTPTFTALENAIAQANAVYNSRLTKVDIENGVFKIYYADGTVYENDGIKDGVYEYMDDKLEGLISEIDASVEQASLSASNAKESETNVKALEESMKVYEANAKASETKAKESELLAEQYKQDALDAIPDNYDEIVEKVGLFDIKTSTDTTLIGTKKGGYRLLELAGNTTQKPIRDGNLYNVSDVGDKYYATADSNGWITASLDNSKGTSAGFGNYFTKVGSVVKPSTTYKLIVEVNELSGASYLCVSYAQGGDVFTENTTITTTGIHEFTLTTVDDFSGILYLLRSFIYVPAGSVGKCVFRISILKDTTITASNFEYKKYTGGAPAPEGIESTFDCVEMIQGYYVYNTGAYTSSSNAIASKNKIQCKSGDKIKLKTDSAYNLCFIFFNNGTYVNNYSASGVKELEYTVPSGVDSFLFYIGASPNIISPDTVGKITLTINGKYVGCIREHGKNLFNAYLVEKTAYGSATVSENGTKVTVTGTYYASCPIEMEPDTPYVISFEIESHTQYRQIVLMYDDGTTGAYFRPESSSSNYEFTPTQKVVSVRIYGGAGTSGTTVYKNIMVRRADTDDTYEPYRETVAHFLMNEPLRLGDVVFRDTDGLLKVERNSAEEVFDGSTATTLIADNRTYYIPTTLSMETTTDNFSVSDIHCSHYKSVAYQDMYDDKVAYGICRRVNGASQIVIRNKDCSTINEFKALLSANPITVKYPLATPTIEVLDTESQIALNSLETFDGATYIEVDSKIPHTGIKGEYGANQLVAYTLKTLNNDDSIMAKLNELSVALVSL